MACEMGEAAKGGSEGALLSPYLHTVDQKGGLAIEHSAASLSLDLFFIVS